MVAPREIRYWAVVPAAGIGKRMNADLPKQYLPLQDRTILEHTLDRLLAFRRLSGIVLAVAPDDPYWPRLANRFSGKPLTVARGGSERCHTVLNALIELSNVASEDDWVLVHDAARPCVRAEDMQRLVDELQSHAVGGLLALPVSDTVKRADAQGNVMETVNREGLWRALTPQMFRVGPLRKALEKALAEGYLVTDEASAMEHAGLAPKVVEGHGDNIKITRPDDLALAALYLELQRN